MGDVFAMGFDFSLRFSEAVLVHRSLPARRAEASVT